ncbi:phosphoglycerate dehydrogenase [Bacillus sp. FJAT-42376]|uniref:phosphoglycerate dehydrogenase n=1 Tax=Bacillus sp. FJAT-42376 TaxID=2014076 RepID=UPI000F4F6D6F|nr:phosphoglycerate dehydrogenase [Bacillus sp. FJAT-42376]AZB43374.1 phosphoglycerate dehydrogenase [Bacillus sp. FJAT-42376]
MFRVLVSDPISRDGLEPLLEADHIEIIQKNAHEESDLSQYDALFVRSATKVTKELMNQMPNLKIIARAGVGVDNIDLEQATRRGIIVINAPDGNTISTAEHTFAMIASLVRHIPQANMSVKNREWKRSSFVGSELHGKMLGIVGLGRIGTELARRAKAFGMRVAVFDPFLTKERSEKIGVEKHDFNELLTQADIITVHTPLTKETKGLLNKETIGKTKKGVYLVNCARGGIIDEDALCTYLENGHVRGVALDVFEVEPPEHTRLLEFEQVIATPHLGASTKEAQLNVAYQVSKEVLLFVEGKQVTTSINLPAMSDEAYQKVAPYDTLAQRIGSFLSQYMNEPVHSITIEYEGTAAEIETAYVTKSMIASFLKQRMDITINTVNAGVLARERGIQFIEKVSDVNSGYSNSMTVTIHGEHKTSELKGTFIPHFGERIVSVNGFSIDFHPSGHLLYIQHTDVPGVIGNVGKILGDHAVNIATMQVGRKEKGGEAIMMLSFDRSLEKPTIAALSNLDEIVFVKAIDL